MYINLYIFSFIAHFFFSFDGYLYLSHPGVAQLEEQSTVEFIRRHRWVSGSIPFLRKIDRVVQLVRTPALHAGDRGFDPHHGYYNIILISNT